MKLIFRNIRWILPSVCVALLLMGAVALPCTAQVIEDRSLGTAGPRSRNRTKPAARAYRPL